MQQENQARTQRRLLPHLVAASALVMGCSAFAQTAKSFQLELSYVPLKVTSEEPTIKPALLRLGLAQHVHRNLDVEVLLGYKVQDDEVQTPFGAVNAEVKYHAGIYLKPKIEPIPRLQAFARLGYGRTKITTDLGKGAESDIGYGLGVGYALTPAMAVNLDYMRYHDKEGITVRGYSLGLGYRF